LRTTSGLASVQFTSDRTIYTAGEGATFAVDYLDGTTTEIQKGSYADVYGENIEDYVELVSEGTTLRSNDSEIVFTLEKAGNYNINGINITATEDNVQLRLADYDTIIFGEFAYTSLNESAALAISKTDIVGMNNAVSSIDLAASADLAGDFLPNYDNEYANALILNDADANAFDTQLTDLIPDTPRLGEIDFNTQPEKLDNLQIVTARQNKLRTEIN